MPYVPSKRKARLSDDHLGMLSSEAQTQDALSRLHFETTPEMNSEQFSKVNNISSMMSLGPPIHPGDLNRSIWSPNSKSKSMQNVLHSEASQLPPSEERATFSSNVQKEDTLAHNPNFNSSYYTLENNSFSNVGKSLSHYNHTGRDHHGNSLSNIDNINKNTEIQDYTCSKTNFTKEKIDSSAENGTIAQSNTTLFIPSPVKDENLPLSLSFLRKPARSGSMDIDVDLIMKQNTLLNSKILDSSGSQIGATENTEAPVSPVSPLSSDTDATNTISERRNSYTNPLVRKKSGELVKSSLKLNHAFQSSGAVSLPATPTYKQVHFGTNIAVKYFDEKDKPISISADNSPYGSDCDLVNESDTPNSDDETELAYYGLTGTVNNSDYSKFLRKKLYDAAKRVVENESLPHIEKFKFEMQRWNLDINQFKTISYRDQLDCEVPVFLERCFINLEKTAIIGQTAVKNISFFKRVVIRYTIDDWLAIESVDAHYTADIPRILKKAGYDRFIFSIPTAQLIYKYYEANKLGSNPEIKFCIQYTAGGHDYWDNNHTKNYTLHFFHEAKSTEIKVTSPKAKSNTTSSSIEKCSNYFTLNNFAEGASVKATSHESNYIPSKNSTLKRSKSFDNKKVVKSVSASPEVVAKTESLNVNDKLLEKNTSFPNRLKSQNTCHETAVNKEEKSVRKESRRMTDSFGEFGPNVIENNETRIKHRFNENYKPNHTPNNNEIYPQAGITKSRLEQTSAKNNQERFCDVDDDKEAANFDEINGVDNESYKTLVEKYCFFNGPSTVSSFENDKEDDGSYFFDSKFY